MLALLYYYYYYIIVADENRDINGHPDDDLKRQRSQYNGDQLYSNVSTCICVITKYLI